MSLYLYKKFITPNHYNIIFNCFQSLQKACVLNTPLVFELKLKRTENSALYFTFYVYTYVYLYVQNRERKTTKNTNTSMKQVENFATTSVSPGKMQ